MFTLLSGVHGGLAVRSDEIFDFFLALARHERLGGVVDATGIVQNFLYDFFFEFFALGFGEDSSFALVLKLLVLVMTHLLSDSSEIVVK